MPILNYKCRGWPELHKSNTRRRQSADMTGHKHPIAHSMVVTKPNLEIRKLLWDDTK